MSKITNKKFVIWTLRDLVELDERQLENWFSGFKEAHKVMRIADIASRGIAGKPIVVKPMTYIDDGKDDQDVIHIENVGTVEIRNKAKEK